ncbi:MAG: transcription termination/antitermination protein NusG [Thermoanaerobaculia bacterium]
MPILKREPDLFPADLFDLPAESRPWSVAHVRSRQEKALARYLHQKQIPFYLPQTENEIITKIAPLSSRAKRGTSQGSTEEIPNADLPASPGQSRNRAIEKSRIRLSHLPLFPGYVFLRHSLDERLVVRQSDVIVSLLEVTDQFALAGELGQLRDLQAAGASLIPCPWIGVGDAVKITEGSFKGYRGVVVREHGRERLIVSIDLVRQSVAVDFNREMLAPDLFPVHQTRATERARARIRF